MTKVVLVTVGVVLLAIGVQGLYTLRVSRQPTLTTCDQLVRQQPRAVWLRVTGCEIDYVNAGFRESSGRIRELLFPVRAAGAGRGGPAALVAATRDPSALSIAQGTIGNGRQPSQEQFLVMMLKIVTTLRASREIEGVVRTGIWQRLEARRLVSGLTVPVAPGAVLIDLHARPRTAVPAVLASAGALALLAAGTLGIRQRHRARRASSSAVSPAQPGEQAATSSTRPASPVAPAAKRLRVLLLALPPEADAHAIEHAPPLGTMEEVRRTLARYWPEMGFDASNRGTIVDAGRSITIDLGAGELAHTAVVDASGAGSAADLRRLVADTGWRMYAPKAGTFVDHEHLDDFVTTTS